MARKFLILLAIFGILVGGFLGYRSIRDARIARRAAELGEVLAEEIREWEARDRSRPPLFEPAVEGTAWEHYREAWRIHEESPVDFDTWAVYDEALSAWPGLPTPFPEVADISVENLERALPALRKGTSTKRAGPALSLASSALTSGPNDDSPAFDRFNQAYALADPLNQAAALSLRRGDAEEAVSRLLILDRLVGDLTRIGGLLDCAFGMTRSGEVRTTLAKLVGGGMLPSGQVDRISSLPPPVAAGWDTLDDSCLTTQAELMNIARGRSDWLPSSFWHGPWYERWWASLTDPTPGEALEAWLRLRSIHDETRREWPGRDDASLGSFATRLGATLTGASAVWDRYADRMRTTVKVILKARADTMELHDMMRLNVALFRFRQREKRDPESIEEIRPSAVRVAPSTGAWVWRGHEAAPRRWIGRGVFTEEDPGD